MYPTDKIFLVPYSVDNDRFVQSANLTDEQKAEVRKRYNVPADRPAVLYAAKFTRRKRPGDLLEAARRLKAETDRPFTVVMAGSGELEQELRAFCAEHALDNVVFTGFVNQSELPALYAASDVFVLPSEHEPWGLAVNEAMCASLPVVVSREVGCVADLVRDGVNGYTPAAGDIEGLARALQRLIEDEGLRRRQGQASLARILQWGYQQCLEGIRSALAGLQCRGSEAKSDVADERHLNRPETHSCVASRASTPIITLPTRLIAPSCGAFAIIWLRAAPMALASGIRKMSVWAWGIAG